MSNFLKTGIDTSMLPNRPMRRWFEIQGNAITLIDPPGGNDGTLNWNPTYIFCTSTTEQVDQAIAKMQQDDIPAWLIEKAKPAMQQAAADHIAWFARPIPDSAGMTVTVGKTA